MDTKLRDQLQKSIVVAQALLDAESALAEAAVKPEPEPEKIPIDQVAVNTTARNKVLASAAGSEKAALFGTLSTPATMDPKALAAATGMTDEMAASVTFEALFIRNEALALTAPVDVKPIEGLK